MHKNIQKNKPLAASSEKQYWLRTHQFVRRWREEAPSIGTAGKHVRRKDDGDFRRVGRGRHIDR